MRTEMRQSLVFTLSALDPRVDILAYHLDLHSVLVLFNASLYKRMIQAYDTVHQHYCFSIRHYIECFINGLVYRASPELE